MATKEDILEQIVEEYLSHKGYFVRHNIKFLPRRDHVDFQADQDSNHSDIDVIGVNPHRSGPDRVWAVSCKSWQSGFNPKKIIRAIEKNGKINGREAWKGFRELTRPKWSEAFVSSVRDHTGSSVFTYVTAVTHLNGDANFWESYAPFAEAMVGNPVRILTFKSMLREIQDMMIGQTLAATEIGRLLQIIKASQLKIVEQVQDAG